MALLKIALIQLNVRAGEVNDNLTRAENYIQTAIAHGVQWILLPELWSSGYDLAQISDFASPLSEGVFTRIANWSARYKVFIAGSLLEQERGKYFNTFTVYSPRGELLASYRKIHLFRSINEDRFLSPGNRLITLDTHWGRIGLATCYDLRFPELFRKLALGGVKLVMLCAEWPQTRIEHWRTLIKARAIENQFYVAAVNAVGELHDIPYGGKSAIVNSWGEYLVEAGESEELVYAQIDSSEVERDRKMIPVFEDRRPDIYGFLSEKS